MCSFLTFSMLTNEVKHVWSPCQGVTFPVLRMLTLNFCNFSLPALPSASVGTSWRTQQFFHVPWDCLRNAEGLKLSWKSLAFISNLLENVVCWGEWGETETWDGGMNHHPSMENAVWSMGGFRDLRFIQACQSDTSKQGPCFYNQLEQGFRPLPDGQISVCFLFLLFTINFWQIEPHQYKFPRQLSI